MTIRVSSAWAAGTRSCVVVIISRIARRTRLEFSKRGKWQSIRSIVQTDLRFDPFIPDLSLRQNKESNQ